MGAIAGALTVGTVRARPSGELVARLCAILFGCMTRIVAMSHMLRITAPALFFAGSAWMLSIALFNIPTQTAAPRCAG